MFVSSVLRMGAECMVVGSPFCEFGLVPLDATAELVVEGTCTACTVLGLVMLIGVDRGADLPLDNWDFCEAVREGRF